MSKWPSSYDPSVPQRESLVEDEVIHPLNASMLEKTRKPSAHQNGQCKSENHDCAHGDNCHGPESGSCFWRAREESRGPVPEDDEDSNFLCGIGSFRPQCLQQCANKKIFLAIFCLASVLQGMYYTYFVSILTTIEKLFQIPSKTTGIIMSATEMGQIGGALLLTYYGGQGHRPKWIACGMLLFAFASFLSSLPHFLYGNELSHALTLSIMNQNSTSLDPKLCMVSNSSESLHEERFSTAHWTSNFSSIHNTSNDSTFLSAKNSSFFPYAQPLTSQSCQDNEPEKREYITNIVLSVLFFSLLFVGIGSTAVYTLGIPYIDDNVANRDSPMYFAITIGVRILGPVFGFLLGSLCTMIYVDPFEEPLITNKDPRWIGAWWLGPFIVAAALVVVSFAMLSFPRKLLHNRTPLVNGLVPSAATTPSINNEPNSTGSNSVLLTHSRPALNAIDPKPSIRDFPATMCRLLKNQILLLRTASTVLHILPIAGLYTFLPKYLEYQFRLTATEASMTSGMAGILIMGVGIFASGTLMRRFKPKPRFVAAWIAVCALAFSIGMLLLTFIGCPITDFVGLQDGSNGWEITAPCNKSCTCDNRTFSPVCTSEGEIYFSACYAGCKNYTKITEGTLEKFVFHDCECLDADTTATLGYCPLACDNFIWYVCVFSLTVFIHSTSEVGSMLMTLRCVDPKDKAMALGLIQFAIGLFGNVPCPIIYGVVVDSACIIWEYTCGRQGACWFYDPSVFRIFFHGITSGIMFVAFIVDAIVWYKASSIHFSDEDQPKTEETQPMNSYCEQFETTV